MLKCFIFINCEVNEINKNFIKKTLKSIKIKMTIILLETNGNLKHFNFSP